MKSGRFRAAYILAVFALVAIGAVAQQPEPERRDDKFRDDAHAYCYKGPEEGSAHNCSCAMVCGPDYVTGEQVQQETTACAMYCSRQRCVCHADEGCGDPELL
jgi:hypothetical protein